MKVCFPRVAHRARGRLSRACGSCSVSEAPSSNEISSGLVHGLHLSRECFPFIENRVILVQMS